MQDYYESEDFQVDTKDTIIKVLGERIKELEYDVKFYIHSNKIRQEQQANEAKKLRDALRLIEQLNKR